MFDLNLYYITPTIYLCMGDRDWLSHGLVVTRAGCHTASLSHGLVFTRDGGHTASSISPT